MAQVTDPAWKRYEADFNAMTDEEVEAERASAQALVDEQEEWLEAVAAWEAAGKPRSTSPYDHSTLHGALRQEGDEYVCAKCRKRWDVHEDAPPCQEG